MSRFFGPDQQRATDAFGAVFDPYCVRFPALFDDPVQASDHTLGKQGKLNLDAQAFAIEVIEHVQQPELAAIAKAISHEVHQSSHVRRVRHGQNVRFVRLQPFAGLDP